MAQFLVFAQLTFRQQGALAGVPRTDKEHKSALILREIGLNSMELYVASSKITVMKMEIVKFSI
jgi:hypothetical protein